MISYKKNNEGNPYMIDRCMGYFEHFFGKDSPFENMEFYIVGGCLRDYFEKNKVDSDIDIFFKSREALDSFKFALSMEEKSKVIFNGPNGIKYKWNGKVVDVIGAEYFPDLESCLNHFDFTVCCAGIHMKNGEVEQLMHHDTYFIDLTGKRLVINNIPAPLATLKRLQKYIKRGYTICDGGLVQLVESLNEVNMSDPEQNQLEFYPDGEEKITLID